jgi:hypothetical protein
MARFDLMDFEWSVIQALRPTKVWGVEPIDHSSEVQALPRATWFDMLSRRNAAI